MRFISTIFNFDNIGRKIKNFTKWSCWIGILLVWIASVINFFTLLANDYTAHLCWIPVVVAIVAPFLIWLGSWVAYAFGEFVDDLHAIRNKECPIPVVEEPSKPTPPVKRYSEEEIERAYTEYHAFLEREERENKEAEKLKMAAEFLKTYHHVTMPPYSTFVEFLKNIPPMIQPMDFTPDVKWDNEIQSLSFEEIGLRYIDIDNWTKKYRYQCYLELNKRNLNNK